jgi:hypothetical protein
VHQCALAGSAHTGDDDEPAQGKFGGDIFQVVGGGIAQGEFRRAVEWGRGQLPILVAVRNAILAQLHCVAVQRGADRTARAARRIFSMLAQAIAGNRIFVAQQFAQCALGDDLASMHARAGAEIDDVIGTAHGFLIVFDDNERVPARAKLSERGEELFIVARMQTDGRFVENVEHAAEVGTQLRREPDALRFAAGQRRDGTMKMQIAESDFSEEFQSFANFRKDIPRDDGFASFEFCASEDGAGVLHRQRGERIDREWLLAQLKSHRTRDRVQRAP